MSSHRYSSSRTETPGARQRWRWTQALALARVNVRSLKFGARGSTRLLAEHVPPWAVSRPWARVPVRIVERHDGERWVLEVTVGSDRQRHVSDKPHDPFVVADEMLAPLFASPESDLRALVLLETGARGAAS